MSYLTHIKQKGWGTLYPPHSLFPNNHKHGNHMNTIKYILSIILTLIVSVVGFMEAIDGNLTNFLLSIVAVEMLILNRQEYTSSD